MIAFRAAMLVALFAFLVAAALWAREDERERARRAALDRFVMVTISVDVAELRAAFERARVAVDQVGRAIERAMREVGGD